MRKSKQKASNFFKRQSLFGVVFFLLFSTLNADEKSTTHRIFQFENEQVIVWKTVIMPNQPLKMHRHDRARVVVGLKGGSLVKVEQTGETSDLDFETGKAYWLDKDPENMVHADINDSNEPIEVMVIELKRPSR